MSGTLWLVNMFGTTKTDCFLSIYPDAHQDLPNQKPQEADIAHFELNSDSMHVCHRLHGSNDPQIISRNETNHLVHRSFILLRRFPICCEGDFDFYCKAFQIRHNVAPVLEVFLNLLHFFNLSWLVS